MNISELTQISLRSPHNTCTRLDAQLTYGLTPLIDGVSSIGTLKSPERHNADVDTALQNALQIATVCGMFHNRSILSLEGGNLENIIKVVHDLDIITAESVPAQINRIIAVDSNGHNIQAARMNLQSDVMTQRMIQNGLVELFCGSPEKYLEAEQHPTPTFDGVAIIGRNTVRRGPILRRLAEISTPSASVIVPSPYQCSQQYFDTLIKQTGWDIRNVLASKHEASIYELQPKS